MQGLLNLLEYAIAAKPDERRYICEQSFAVFCMYYFAEYFIYKIPPFHLKMYRELQDLATGKFKYLLWVMFRESAKTSIAKMYIVYSICYRKKRFINYDSYDKGNAEAALFDIATWLQTNEKIIMDFGHLFFENNRLQKEAKLKRISEFITANRVKVKAYSTQESTRGRIFLKWRPDLYVLDDIETEVTIKSAPVTAKIISHIDALKSGIATDGQVIFLGNLISDTGTIASLIKQAKEDPTGWRYHRVDVDRDEKGEPCIMWPDKYVWTDEEALALNATIADRKSHKVSLSRKKKDLNSGGKKVYEAEMQNDPEASGELFFTREKVDYDIARARNRKPIKVVGGLSIWESYAARNRYAFGGDTAKGVSRDACASVGLRFAHSDKDAALVVATYSSNTIAPDAFGDEIASHGRMFGECLLAPELNNTGFATVTRLKAVYPQGKIYRQVKQDQLGNTITKDLGWEANSSNVSSIYYNFRSAYNDGHVEIFCPALLAEMRTFTRADLENSSKRSDVTVGSGVVTKHFDLLRAACIAWEMRNHASTKVLPSKTYKQAPYEPRSDYQG